MTKQLQETIIEINHRLDNVEKIRNDLEFEETMIREGIKEINRLIKKVK